MLTRFVRETLLFIAVPVAAFTADDCRDAPPLSADRAVRYVARKYQVPAQAALHLEAKQHVGQTCYWKLVFAGDGAIGPYRLIMYASPDLRFLSSDLLDSYADADREERAEAEEKMGKLLEGEYASIGQTAAPVTVVVFSDFQCPYCKKLRTILVGEPLIATGDKVRVVFRHMPGTRHDWAQKAAEAAACAQLQNGEAFWRLHDALFEYQEEITAANFDSRLGEFASGINSLDPQDFGNCLDRQMSLGMVLRDRQLGAALGVKGTPTIFINGELQVGLPDAVDFHNRLVKAIDEASAHAVAH